MKSVIYILASLPVLCLMSFQSNCQPKDTTITIREVRNPGTEIKDTSTVGFTSGQLTIDHFRKLNSGYSEIKSDSVHLYQIHFYKMYQNKLTNYQFGYSGEMYFDKARYYWINETIVSVTLYNSNTEISKSIKLEQVGNGVGVYPE